MFGTLGGHMAAVPTTYQIGLQIPQEAQRELHAYATEWALANDAQTILSPGQYSIQLMSVVSRSEDVLDRIQRAFADVQQQLRELKGDSFSVSTQGTCLLGRRTVVGLCVHSYGAHLPGWTQQGSIGHLRRLFDKLTTAFRQQGIPEDHISTMDEFCPHVSFARVKDPGAHFTDAVITRQLPERYSVQWPVSVDDLFVG
jgi:2'-5' RNA ligase